MSKKEQLEEALSEVENLSIDDIESAIEDVEDTQLEFDTIRGALEKVQSVKTRKALQNWINAMVSDLQNLKDAAQAELDAAQTKIDALQNVIDTCDSLESDAQGIVDNLED
jgi:molecular chaperone GrpE (heat shock protein)